MRWVLLALPVVVAVPAAFWVHARRYRIADDEVHRTLPAWLIPLVVAVGAVVAAPFFAGRGVAVVITYGLGLVWATVLAFIDLDVRRLPDVLTLPGYAGVAVGLTGCSAATGDWTALLRAAAVAGLAVAAYLIAALVAPGGGLGFGDVKLAGTLGALLGWFGWTTALLGLLSGFIIGGLVAAVLLVVRRADRRSHISFGPAMIVGAYVWCLLALPA